MELRSRRELRKARVARARWVADVLGERMTRGRDHRTGGKVGLHARVDGRAIARARCERHDAEPVAQELRGRGDRGRGVDRVAERSPDATDRRPKSRRTRSCRRRRCRADRQPRPESRDRTEHVRAELDLICRGVRDVAIVQELAELRGLLEYGCPARDGRGCPTTRRSAFRVRVVNRACTLRTADDQAQACQCKQV